MTARSWTFAAALAGALAIAACTTPQQQDTTDSDGATQNTSGGATSGTTGGTTGGTGGTGTSLPGLVNVNLENVLNNLSVALSVDRTNIPVNAQVPVDVAANVCGVSVNVLAASLASGNASCTATTTSPQLIQIVSQTMSSGGTSGGGTTTNNMM